MRREIGLSRFLKTRQRVRLGFVNVKNTVQLGELKQVCHLSSRIAQLQLAPGLAFLALTLGTVIPIAVFILEHRGTALSTDGLSHGPQRHDQLTKTTAIDVGNVFQVEQDSVVTFRHFIPDRLPQSRERFARRDSTGKIHDRNGV